MKSMVVLFVGIFLSNCSSVAWGIEAPKTPQKSSFDSAEISGEWRSVEHSLVVYRETSGKPDINHCIDYKMLVMKTNQTGDAGVGRYFENLTADTYELAVAHDADAYMSGIGLFTFRVESPNRVRLTLVDVDDESQYNGIFKMDTKTIEMEGFEVAGKNDPSGFVLVNTLEKVGKLQSSEQAFNELWEKTYQKNNALDQ